MFKKDTPLLSMLVITSIFAAILSISRFYFSENLRFTFLIWNLFLAWLPVVFAWLVRRQLHKQEQFLGKRPFILFLMLLWLLFLPNAPYIVTDFVHLRPMKNTPLWFDALMIFSFAITGLLLGFLSLDWLQTAVQQRYGRLTGWLFAFASLSLTGIGVYIGRVLRWNSWDILTRPTAVFADVLNNYLDTTLAWQTWSLSLTIIIALMLSYFCLRTWPWKSNFLPSKT